MEDRGDSSRYRHQSGKFQAAQFFYWKEGCCLGKWKKQKKTGGGRKSLISGNSLGVRSFLRQAKPENVGGSMN